MPNISTSKTGAAVAGFVKPIDKPTVPSEEANSNIPSVKPQPAVSVISSEPTRNRQKYTVTNVVVPSLSDSSIAVFRCAVS